LLFLLRPAQGDLRLAHHPVVMVQRQVDVNRLGGPGVIQREFSVDVRRSEAVTLRQPVMPVFDSFAG
jgi:hypothetical protein